MRIFITAAAVGTAMTFGAPAIAEKDDMMKAEMDKSAEMAKAEDARLVAVLSYADWCGACQVLDPKLADLRAAPPEGVNVVTLDYTARDKDAYFGAAEAAGVGDVVRAHFDGGVKTGMVLLIDVDDGTVVGKISKDMDEAAIREKVTIAATKA